MFSNELRSMVAEAIEEMEKNLPEAQVIEDDDLMDVYTFMELNGSYLMM